VTTVERVARGSLNMVAYNRLGRTVGDSGFGQELSGIWLG
jgi:hypothetical protein